MGVGAKVLVCVKFTTWRMLYSAIVWWGFCCSCCCSSDRGKQSQLLLYSYSFDFGLEFDKKLISGNEVDQLFSILASEFQSEILTVDDLKEKILNAPISPKPECCHLWYIFGWRDYISDHLADEPLQNHSRFNSFKIIGES